MSESKKMTSLTKNTYKNPSPLKTNAKQAKTGGTHFDSDIADSSNVSNKGPKNSVKVPTPVHGATAKMHGKAVGGHPEHRASEFSGKGKGHMTDCG